VNVVALTGVVSRAPLARESAEGGVASTTFRLAVQETTYGGTSTTYVPCMAWGKVVARCGALQSADVVALTGRLAWHKHKSVCGREHTIMVVAVKELIVLEAAAEVPA